MKIISLTGVTGHVGNNLCRYLPEKGYRLKGLARNPAHPSLEGMAMEIVQGDLFNREAIDRLCSGADIVIHLAAKVSIYPSDREIIHKTNIEGTREVIEGCIRNGVKKLIYFSSVHAHRMDLKSQVIDEKTQYVTALRPAYDHSKASSEKLVLSAREKGLDTVILNPTAILGPFDFGPSYTGSMFTDIYTGKMNMIVKGGFDWVDVRDVCMATEKVISKDIVNEKFMLSGHFAELKEMADMILSVKNSNFRGLTLPLELAYAGLPIISLYSALSGRLPLYTPESLRAIRHGRKKIDNSKASKMLDYVPRELNSTVTETMRWLINHYKLNDE